MVRASPGSNNQVNSSDLNKHPWTSRSIPGRPGRSVHFRNHSNDRQTTRNHHTSQMGNEFSRFAPVPVEWFSYSAEIEFRLFRRSDILFEAFQGYPIECVWTQIEPNLLTVITEHVQDIHNASICAISSGCLLWNLKIRSHKYESCFKHLERHFDFPKRGDFFTNKSDRILSIAQNDQE